MLEKFDWGTLYRGLAATGGGALSYFYGGWSTLLKVLLFFVIADYITGMVASGLEGKLSSSIGMKGIIKKVFIFVIVAVAHMADTAIGNGSILMDATIFFYIANELLSITENAGRVGVPLPDVLVQAVDILKSKAKSTKKA